MISHVVILSALLGTVAHGAPVISKARGESTLEVPISPEFSEVRNAMSRYQSLDSLPPAKAQSPPPPLKRQARRLPQLPYSVFDATLNEREQRCREECVAHFTKTFKYTEATICEAHLLPKPTLAASATNEAEPVASTANTQLAFDSCGTGVDAGLYSGCVAWCDPKEPRTNNTFRFDKVFQLVDKIKSAASHVKEQCASVQGGGGSIVIQRRSTKERGQVVQTAACKHGFQSGFATLLVTQQRLHGLDRLNVPVAYYEHNVMENPRRQRFFYWWGGTDVATSAAAECYPIYRDNPQKLDSCTEKLQSKWSDELARLVFVLNNPKSTIGELPMSTSNAPLLKQRVSLRALDNVSTSHTATRHLGQNATDAARVFCLSHEGLRMEPYYSKCVVAIAHGLALESEVSDAELPSLRLV